MSEPYYSDDLVTLYHGDCLAITPWLDTDLLVTDPPYGSEGASGYGRSALGARRIANDRTIEVRDAALALWGERPAVVFAHPSLAEPPGDWDYRLVWDKRFPGLGGGSWQRLIDGAQGEVLADPFAGSGSTLVAAKTLGRRIVGVELDERWCELAAKRLTQDTLFGGAA